MSKELSKAGSSVFEQIKKLDENGNEFWSGRDIANVLDYLEYRNFKPIIEKAKDACKNSGHAVEDQFVDFHEIVKIGSDAERDFVWVKTRIKQ